MKPQIEEVYVSKHVPLVWAIISVSASIIVFFESRLVLGENPLVEEIMLGFLIGFFQWLLLRRHLSSAWWWILLTVSGVVGVSIINPSLQNLLSFGIEFVAEPIDLWGDTYLNALFEACNCNQLVEPLLFLWRLMLFVALVNLVIGFMHSIPQWLYLQRKVKHSKKWILAYTSTLVAIAVILTFISRVRWFLREVVPLTQETFDNVYFQIALIIIMQFPLYFIMGMTVKYLLKHPKQISREQKIIQ